MSHDWKKEGPRSARRSALPWMTGGIFPLTGVGMARSRFSSLTAVANSVSHKQATDQALPELLVGGKDTLSQARLSPYGSQLLYLLYPGDSAATPMVSRCHGFFRWASTTHPASQVDHNLQCARSPATVCVYSEVTDTGVSFFSFDPIREKPHRYSDQR